MQAPVIWSDPQLTNTQTMGNQYISKVTALANGGYVVSWAHQYNPPVNADKTYFQIYDALGNKVGGETIADTPNNSISPQVAALSGGGFVIAQYSSDYTGSWGIRAQVFGDTGNAVSLPFIASSEDDMVQKEDQHTPSVTGLSNGGFAIGYIVNESDGSRTIRVQLFHANGDKNGTEIFVETDAAGTLDELKIKQTSDGLFAIAWRAGPSAEQDVYMRVYHDDGTPETAVLPLTNAVNSQSMPEIATDGLGNVMVTYQQQGGWIDAKILTADGTLVVPAFTVNDPAQNQQVAMYGRPVGLPGGGFLVVWQEVENTTSVLVGQVIDAEGNKIGPETVIFAGPTDGDLFTPSDIAALGDGRVVVTLWGQFGAGDDTDAYSVHTLIVDMRSGTVEGTDEDDLLVGLAGNVDDIIIAKDGNDVLYGLDGDDTMYGGRGDDTLDGGAGADSLVGGSGDDYYIIDDVDDIIVETGGGGTDTAVILGTNYTLAAGVEVEILQMTGDNDSDITGNELGQWLKGDASNNKLIGMGGNDTLEGGANIDYMEGGEGDDLYIVDHAMDFVIEVEDGGNDTIQTHLSYSLEFLEHVENLTLTGNDAIDGTGNALANVITGNSNDNVLEGGAGNDTLDGGEGADTLKGGSADDTYVVDNVNDEVVEFGDEGNDTVQSWLSYTLGEHVENLTLLGSAQLDGHGNILANVLTGNSAGNKLTGGIGNDTLDGQGGNDTMEGGEDDDTYVVSQAGDVVVEAANEGHDTVLAYLNYTLGDNVEALVLVTGTNATGNALANTLTGNAGNNVLDGKAGADTMIGLAGDDHYIVNDAGDVVVETAKGGFDRVTAYVDHTLNDNVEKLSLVMGTNATGNGSANIIEGNAGANTINGLGGADTMTGFAGDDTYIVDDAGDVVVESANGGNDTVIAHVDHALAANVETLVLAAGYLAKGNNLGNAITGNAGANLLDGQGGADTMAGGAGDDSYVVDNAGDVIIENAGGGFDTVYTRFDTTLAANLEGLVLTGSAKKGTGNSADNWLVGNAGANTLKGGLGNDTIDGGGGKDVLEGGKGNDTYVLGKSKDKVNDKGGTDDTITSTSSRKLADFNGIENLTLVGTGNVNGTGNNAANDLIGNAGNNELKGGGGKDMLAGGLGRDLLWGNAGKDKFDFNSILEIGKAKGARDIIRDFEAGDRIDLSTIDANLLVAGNDKFKLLAQEGSKFSGAAGELIWDQKDKAGTSKDVTLVSGDIDGDKVADFTLELTGLHNLNQGDFIL